MCYFHRYLEYPLPLLALITYLERYLLSLLFMFSLLFTALFLVRLFQAVPILLTFYISPTFYRFVPHLLILGGAYLLTFYISPTFYRFVPHLLTLGGANLAYFLYFTYFLPLCSSFAYSRRYFYNLIPVTNILPSLSLKFENVAQTCAIRDL